MKTNNGNQEKRIEKIKKLLKEKNGEITEDLKKEVQSLTKEKKDSQINNITKGFTNSYDSQEVINNIANIEPPDIVKDSIKKIISSMLDPLRTTFISEISKYVDSISIEEKIKKKIPRAIQAKKIKKIENGKFIQATNVEGWVVNPEFKQLLATGYKPKEDSEEYQKKLKEGKIGELDKKYGTPESDYIRDRDGNFITDLSTKTEQINITKNNYAGIFKKPFADIQKNIAFTNNEFFKEISMTGFSLENTEVKNLKYVQNPASVEPNWKISYKEIGTKYYLNIDNNFEYFGGNKITTNTSSYYFVGHLDTGSLSQEAKNLLNSINQNECNIYNNSELYCELVAKLPVNIFDTSFNNNRRQQFKNFYCSKYNSLLSGFISGFFTSYENNRLLRKFNPQTPGLNNSEVEQVSNLIILNLLNFIPEVSQELIDCGKQPHPLNLDLIIDLMAKKFNNIGIQLSSQIENCVPNIFEKPKNPISEAAAVGTAIMFLRICILENILKSLFVLDEHQYSFDILDSGLLSDFILVKIIEELESYNLSEEVQQIIEENYSFLKENLNISADDEDANSSLEKIIVNKQKFSVPSSQMKNLVKHLTKKTFGYLKNLIGVVQGQNINFSLLEQISSNIIYEIPNNQILDFTKSSSDLRNSSENYSRRFSNRDEQEFFTLEKYIEIENSPFNDSYFYQNNLSDVLGVLKQKYNYIDGYINITMYSKFLQDITSEPLLNLANSQIISGSVIYSKLVNFLSVPKIGIRLVQNSLSNIDSKSWTEIRKNLLDSDTKNEENARIKENLKKFSYGSNTSNIRDNILSKYKMYGFYDIDLDKNELRYYNSLPISVKSVDVTFKEFMKNNLQDLRSVNNVFNSKKTQLLNLVVTEPKYEILMKKSLFLDKLPNLAFFYSNSALSNQQMETLFDGSKKRIHGMYEAAMNIDNYKYKNETDRKGGNAKKYQNDIANVGNPNGGVNLDLLQFLITTPILILKGLTQIIDPNIAIASQIVNAASAGLLFPKLDADGNVIGYPGDKIILPTALASLALLPVNIFAPLIGPLAIGPPVTPLPGMLYWALEPLLWKLPFFQNQAANSDAAKKLKDDPRNKGLKIGDTSSFKCDKDQDE